MPYAMCFYGLVYYVPGFELKSSESQVKIEDMQGDHIMPWCQGGRTVDDNLQMFCLPDLQL